jgi:integrase
MSPGAEPLGVSSGLIHSRDSQNARSSSHVGTEEIVITTGKILAHIPRRSPTILTNSKHRPWTRDGFGSSFNKAKIAANMVDADLHFHDLRGTAATRFYIAGLPERAIAGIMGWEEEHVAKIIRRYVDRGAATKAIIRQLNERRT